MIHFENVCKYFGNKAAVESLNLTIQSGEFVVLIGTSGSGKSTTLKMINRLIEHDRGFIRFAGEEIRQFEACALRRRMGYAVQSTGLFPHWTVARNIATVPMLLKWPKTKIAARVAELLDLLNLEDTLTHRYPHQLSGGQQQRVGVARALAAKPEVLLMDEPFGALDPVTRATLQQEMLRVHQLSGCTIVLVTHDIDEALTLGERLILMDGGKIVQQGKPIDLLTRPANQFVRDFFGQNELGLRMLALTRAGEVTRRDEWLEGATLVESASLREAASSFIAHRTDKLSIVDAQQQPLGVLYLSDLLRCREQQ